VNPTLHIVWTIPIWLNRPYPRLTTPLTFGRTTTRISTPQAVEFPTPFVAVGMPFGFEPTSIRVGFRIPTPPVAFYTELNFVGTLLPVALLTPWCDGVPYYGTAPVGLAAPNRHASTNAILVNGGRVYYGGGWTVLNGGLICGYHSPDDYDRTNGPDLRHACTTDCLLPVGGQYRTFLRR